MKSGNSGNNWQQNTRTISGVLPLSPVLPRFLTTLKAILRISVSEIKLRRLTEFLLWGVKNYRQQPATLATRRISLRDSVATSVKKLATILINWQQRICEVVV